MVEPTIQTIQITIHRKITAINSEIITAGLIRN
jgi:hypothetical protein